MSIPVKIAAKLKQSDFSFVNSDKIVLFSKFGINFK